MGNSAAARRLAARGTGATGYVLVALPSRSVGPPFLTIEGHADSLHRRDSLDSRENRHIARRTAVTQEMQYAPSPSRFVAATPAFGRATAPPWARWGTIAAMVAARSGRRPRKAIAEPALPAARVTWSVRMQDRCCRRRVRPPKRLASTCVLYLDNADHGRLVWTASAQSASCRCLRTPQVDTASPDHDDSLICVSA